jgi:CRP-like cAMP-binding protein
MSSHQSRVNRHGSNRLLSLLPAPDRARVLRRCTFQPLKLGQRVYAAGGAIEYIYFPLSGVISLLLDSKAGDSIEVGVVGNEGFAGTPVALGAGRSDLRAVVQCAGQFLRMGVDDFRAELKRRSRFAGLMHSSVQALMAQVSQSVLCNRVHGVEQRTCRWMLMAHDRAGTDVMQLTQQFIAEMLGIRRASVTVAARALQKKGILRYSRGKVTVVDRAGLEAGACECYSMVVRETERLLLKR